MERKHPAIRLFEADLKLIANERRSLSFRSFHFFTFTSRRVINDPVA